MPDRVMLVVGAPPDAIEDILNAIADAGGGVVGDYTHCAFTQEGFGQFKPSDKATPHIGNIGKVNQVKEVRIETFCERHLAKQVVQAIKAVHPYEEVIIYIIPLLDETDL